MSRLENSWGHNASAEKGISLSFLQRTNISPIHYTHTGTKTIICRPTEPAVVTPRPMSKVSLDTITRIYYLSAAILHSAVLPTSKQKTSFLCVLMEWNSICVFVGEFERKLADIGKNASQKKGELEQDGGLDFIETESDAGKRTIKVSDFVKMSELHSLQI